MQRVMPVLLLVAAACGGDDGGSVHLVDGSVALDSASSADGATQQPGLEVTWMDIPSLPGPVSSTVMVKSASFHLNRLEVIGDGDPLLTTRNGLDLRWSMALRPFPMQFESAPAGIYSKVRLAIDKDGAMPAFDITGMVSINGTDEPFHISSTEKLDLEITGYEVTLFLGSSADVNVKIDLSLALANVNWSALSVRNSTRTLDDTDVPAMSAFLGDLADAFVEYP